jgi:hypothetical protein
VKEHLSSIHTHEIEKVEAGKRLYITIDPREHFRIYPQRIIATLGEMFMQCGTFRENKFYCIVQYIGPKNDANKYRYKFSVSREEESGQISEMSVSQVVSSETDNLVNICETCNCVSPYQAISWKSFTLITD